MPVDGVSTDACIQLIKKDVTYIKDEVIKINSRISTKVDKNVCAERINHVQALADGLKQLQRFVWGVLASTILLLVSIILTNVWSK